MLTPFNISITVWLVGVLILVFLVKYNWQRRWLYYYASKIPGPLALPVLGSVAIFTSVGQDFNKTIQKICQSQAPTFKLWVGNALMIISSEPEDLEILFSTFLEKSLGYKNVTNKCVKNSLFSAPVSIWKDHRKLINPTFNPRIIASFHDIFVKYSEMLVKELENTYEQEITDLMIDIWKINWDEAIETLTAMDPVLVEDRYDALAVTIRMEQIGAERLEKVWLHTKLLWRFSPLRREIALLSKKLEDYCKKMVALKKKHKNEEDKKNVFLPYLVHLSNKGRIIEEKEIVEESAFMYIAASETTASSIAFVVTVLALYPEIQDTIFQELQLVSNEDENLSLESVNKMEYLERVIKETLRLFPTVPIVARCIDKNIKLGSYLFPEGSHLLVSITQVHRRPDLWPDPLKFDPDRFLPEEVAKRHRCAYIPFSFGTRNCIGVLVLVFLVKYNWQRRWLYYYASKIPGPLALPVLGSVEIFTSVGQDFYQTIQKICQSQLPVFKLWIGNDLYIVNSEPEHLDVLLSTFLEKSPFYETVINEFIKNSLLSAPVGIWKGHRKLINPTFNPKIIASFHDIFVKYSKMLVKYLESTPEEDISNLLIDIWKFNWDAAFETLTAMDPVLVDDRYESLAVTVRIEQITIERIQKFWLLIDFVWWLSPLRREAESLRGKLEDYCKKLIALKKKLKTADANGKYKESVFLPYLIHLSNKGGNIKEREIVEESAFMYIAASETTAASVAFVVTVLALYPEIQNKIFQELQLVSNGEENLPLESVNRMEYLERVIKETIRLFPTVPMVMRYIDRNIKLGSYLFPAESNLLVSITQLHRRPDLWPDPLRFDPDRFLPEEVAKRHRCAYIPFSFGTRNCIGFKYGIMSMKVKVAYIIKHFTIKALNYHSIEDIEVDYHIVEKPKGCRVMFTQRKGLY